MNQGYTVPRRNSGEAENSASLQNIVNWKVVLEEFLATLQVKPASIVSYRKSLVQFFKWMTAQGKQLDSLKTRDLVEFTRHLLDDSPRHTPNTVQLYVCALRQFYFWAEEHEYYQNIARNLKGPRRRQTHIKNDFVKQGLTQEEATSLLNFFMDYNPCRKEHELKTGHRRKYIARKNIVLRNYAMVNLMLRCGLRTIEVSRLTEGNIDYRNGHRVLMVWGKGHDNADDYVVLTDAAYGPIEEYLATKTNRAKDAPLFSTLSLNGWGKPLSTRRIQCICKDGLRGIGIDSPSYTAHSLRHTTGELLIEKGASLLDAQNAMRHASPNTTEIYIARAKERRHMENPAEALLDDCFKVNI